MKGTAWLLAPAVMVAVLLVACGVGESPTAPAIGPSPGGGVGPQPGGGVGPQPGGGVGPGGGGGGPSPTPTPSGSPTPSPSPSTVPCPSNLTITAVNTPTFLAGAINNNALFPGITTNYEQACVVKEVKITMRVTTTTGFVSTPTDYTSPVVTVGVCGSGVGFSGCSQSRTYSFQSNATGNEIGATCGDFVFDTAAATVFDPASPPPPPYSGTYQWDPARTGVGDLWRLNSLQYSLINTFDHPPDTTLECAQIDITTQLVP